MMMMIDNFESWMELDTEWYDVSTCSTGAVFGMFPWYSILCAECCRLEWSDCWRLDLCGVDL